MRVLHIDDDPDQVAVTKTYLESFNPGMEVVSSISTVDFQRMIETKEFDCVLCDYLMPEMNGIELCRLVRKTSDIPFIIYTGQGSEEVVPIAFAAGVDDYIRKEPGQSHYQVLAKRVRQAVEKYWVEGLYRKVLENSRDGIVIAQGTRLVYANQSTADLVGASRAREGIFRDFTQQKQMEEELRKSEERHRTLFSQSPFAIVTSDLLGRITDVNDAAIQMSGFQRDEFIGKHFSRLPMLTPSEIPRYLHLFRSLLRGEPIGPLEIAVRDKYGKTGVLELHVSFVKEDGENVGLQAVFKDVTIQKETEEALKRQSIRLEELVSERTSELGESEERFRNVINNLPMGVHMYKIDANGDLRFVAANPTADEQLSTPSSSYIGKTIEEGFPNVIDGEIQDRLKEIAEKGGFWHKEDIRYEDDQIINASDNYIFHTAPGEMASVFIDITEQKRMEENLVSAERLAAVGRVAAMMGHDLRGPLVVVRNAVNMARKNPEKTGKMLDMIDRNASQAMDLIEELSTRTMDEPVSLATMEIREILRKATEDVFPSDDVEITIEIEGDASELVLDEAKTLRALDNLIRNAIEAMPDGGMLTLGATRETDQYIIRVSDTGTGIPDEARRNLFKPFNSTKPGGMGLGLASAKCMVEVQGGTISLENTDGVGSIFTITLPLKELNP
jgi:PAS domain S-box-containing protein